MMTIHLQKRNTTPNQHKYPIGNAYTGQRSTKPSLIKCNGGPPKGDDNIRPFRGNGIPRIPKKKTSRTNTTMDWSYMDSQYPALYLMPPFLVPNLPPSKKSLPYPIYALGTYLNIHVQMFPKAIHANGERNDAYIVYLFCFTF